MSLSRRALTFSAYFICFSFQMSVLVPAAPKWLATGCHTPVLLKAGIRSPRAILCTPWLACCFSRRLCQNVRWSLLYVQLLHKNSARGTNFQQRALICSVLPKEIPQFTLLNLLLLNENDGLYVILVNLHGRGGGRKWRLKWVKNNIQQSLGHCIEMRQASWYREKKRQSS